MMVEIRKLLDDTNTKKDFPWLGLFCDCILHKGIERKPDAADWLLKNFDEMLRRESKGFTLEFLDYLSLAHLRKELRSLFSKYTLPTSITDIPEEWDRFLEHLSCAVSDCPIEFIARGKLQFVKPLTLTKELPHEFDLPANRKPFKMWMNWKVECTMARAEMPFYN